MFRSFLLFFCLVQGDGQIFRDDFDEDAKRGANNVVSADEWNNGTCENHAECATPFSHCVNSNCVCVDGYLFSEGQCRLTAGFLKESCQSQPDCKGRFTYCNKFKQCVCLIGYFSEGQHCVAIDHDVNSCNLSSDCNKKFTICVDGRCTCKLNFYLQGYECVPIQGALGDHCNSKKPCAIPTAICVNDQCHCDSHYYQQGHDCVDRNYLPTGMECSSDAECPNPNSFCEKNQCFCANGYKQIGYECVARLKSNAGDVTRTQRFSHDPHQPNTETYLGKYCNNFYDCGGTVAFYCNLVSRRCECSSGFHPTEKSCGLVGIPQQNEADDQRGNSHHYKTSYPQPPNDSGYDEDDSQYIITRFPANPRNHYSGTHGHQCMSSDDCILQDLFCNPSTRACECSQPFILEGRYCVRKELIKYKYIPTYARPTSTRSYSQGGTCYVDADCYSEILICDKNTLKCVCSARAKLEGPYCVYDNSYQYQTEYQNSDQHSSSQPGRNYPIYRPSTHNTPTDNHPSSSPYQQTLPPVPPNSRFNSNFPTSNRGQTLNLYDPNSAPSHQPSETRPIPPISPDSSPLDPPNRNQAISTRSNYPGFNSRRPAYGVNPHNMPRSGGKVECSENKHCFDQFSYCNRASYKCECIMGYAWKNGACVRSGESNFCVKHGDCELPNTHCSENKCACNHGYKKLLGQCVVITNPDRPDGNCYRDEDCTYKAYSRCVAQKCRCLDAFFSVDGNCIPPRTTLMNYCSKGFLSCETENSECDDNLQQCVCKTGYSEYVQTCRQDGLLHGWCNIDRSCNQAQLTCDLTSYRCKCASGMRQTSLWSCG